MITAVSVKMSKLPLIIVTITLLGTIGSVMSYRRFQKGLMLGFILGSQRRPSPPIHAAPKHHPVFLCKYCIRVSECESIGVSECESIGVSECESIRVSECQAEHRQLLVVAWNIRSFDPRSNVHFFLIPKLV